MRVAFVGCLHGELNAIYDSVKAKDQADREVTDVIICPGDFQACRDETDLDDMKAPPKFKQVKDFHQYYSGAKVAPYLTIFVGGNHEAAGFLKELFFGGYVARNIYYMGAFSTVVLSGGLTIAGSSGIYKEHSYYKGYYELPPFIGEDQASVSHTRRFGIETLVGLGHPVDIVITHDWPINITDYGDKTDLIRRKPHFEQDIKSRQLGSPGAQVLLDNLQPQIHAAAHLHVRFTAQVRHEQNNITNFLALNKPVSNGDFLEIREVIPRYDTAFDPAYGKVAIPANWVFNCSAKLRTMSCSSEPFHDTLPKGRVLNCEAVTARAKSMFHAINSYNKETWVVPVPYMRKTLEMSKWFCGLYDFTPPFIHEHGPLFMRPPMQRQPERPRVPPGIRGKNGKMLVYFIRPPQPLNDAPTARPPIHPEFL